MRSGLLFRVQRAGGVDEQTAGSQVAGSRFQELVLKAMKFFQIFPTMVVKHIGVAAQGSAGTAGRVQEDPLGRLIKLQLAGVHELWLGGQAEAAEIFIQTAQGDPSCGPPP